MVEIDEKKLNTIIRQVYLTELGEGKKNTTDKTIVDMQLKMIKEKVDAYKED